MNAVQQTQDLIAQMQLMNRVHAALSSTLKREEVDTLILATLTAPKGLNFQRAFLWTYQPDVQVLTGHMAMGPSNQEAAREMMAEIAAEEAALQQIAATMGSESGASHHGDANQENDHDDDLYRETMQGLQISAYWIAMLQQYEPNNPLTQRLRTIEQVREQAEGALSNVSGPGALPRFIDFISHEKAILARKSDLKLSDTMREILADQFIILPLVTSQGPCGLAVLDNKYREDNELDESSLEPLKWFSTQVSLALENSQLFSDLQHAFEALKEVDKLKSNFLSTISHELRTPLTAINGFVHLLLNQKVGDLTPAQSDLLKRVKNHGQHLTNIVNDLIEVAEVQSGGLEDVESEVVDPLICLMNTLPKLEHRRAGKNVEIEPHIIDNLPYIRSNTRILERIYYHLLDNAIKFVDDDGTGHVDIQFRPQRGRLHIDIIDNGIGIEPDRLRVIFECFFQVDNQLARNQNGLGVGLSVTKLLLDSVQGAIHVESTPNKGSTFTISFPIANEKIDGLPRLS